MGTRLVKRRAEPAEGRASAVPEALPDEGARVLVVDDDERNLLAIERVLEDIAEVVTASSGEEALRHLLKGEFAVILLDVFMPGMDGYETAQIIRARDQSKRIPIVFLSAVNKETEHLMRGYSMGAVDYVFKPVEPIVLRSKVAVFVDLYTMRREVQRKAEQEQALLDENLKANAERLRVERELRLAEQRQAAIIESLPIILYLEGAEAADARVPQFVGGNFTSVTGYRFEDVQADPKLWNERLHPEDRDRVIKALADRGRTGSMAIEYRWRCSDGHYRHFLDQAVLLQGSEDGGSRFAGTLLDVTDRKELENQLLQARKMDAIGQLTGGIAHDFNNLLAAVLGGIGLIERKLSLDDEHRKIIGMTRHAAEQGSELVGRLLAFSRRQQLQPAEVDLGRLAANVTDLLSHTLGGLVQLEWEVASGVWHAYADEAQLELAVMNLIINARDAMEEGGTICIVADNQTVAAGNDLGLAAGDYVVVSVEDKGCGIAPELLEQVTEPFFTTKDVGKGTGLGLSMVYGFARQSEGTIDIASKVGEGTRVAIWLPRAEAAPKSVAQSPANGTGGSQAARSLRILLVDDHEAVRETTAALLREMGHRVEAVGDGLSMLTRLEAAPTDYDLVVTDYAMPLLSGGEAMIRARAIRPDLPGLIISGYADADSIARKPPNVAVLTKPFGPDDIARVIDGVCPP